MRFTLFKLAIALLISGTVFGQVARTTLTASSATAGSSVLLIGSGVLYHQLVWTVSGTVSSCSVTVDSSADGVTWTSGGVISAQTCTANGNSPIANVNVNYVRINFSTVAGGGSVTAVYYGYVTNPATGGSGTVTSVGLSLPTFFTVSGSPVTSSGTLTGSYATGLTSNEGQVLGVNGTGAAGLFAPSTFSVPTQTGTITTGDCVKWASASSITDSGGACGGGGSGLPSSWTVNGTTNAVTAACVSGQDCTPITVQQTNVASPAADIFDVKDKAGNIAFGVLANDNLSFMANSLQLGTVNQATASSIQMPGGTGASSYLEMLSSTLSPPSFGNANVTSSTSAGSVPSGTYTFWTTYLAGASQQYETTTSTSGAITTSATGEIFISVPTQVAGATGLKIYGKQTANGSIVLCGTLVYPSTWTAGTCTSSFASGSVTITGWANSPTTSLPTSNNTGGVFQSFLSTSVNNGGILCESSSAPGQDCNSGTWIPTQATLSPVTGDCVKWTGVNQIGDAGAACGGGGGSPAWSSITNPTANLTLSMGANSTTFGWSGTNGGQWVWDTNGNIQQNSTTAATSTANYASPTHTFTSTFYNGTASANDTYVVQTVPTATSSNPNIYFEIIHNGGTTGQAGLVVRNDPTDYKGAVYLQTCGTSSCDAFSENDSSGTARAYIDGNGNLTAASVLSNGVINLTTTGQIKIKESGAPTGAAGSDWLYANSTTHNLHAINNNDVDETIPGSVQFQSSATNTNIAATNIIASASANHMYNMSWVISLTAAGAGCTGSTTVTMNAIFTDPNTTTAVTQSLGTITIASSGNGTVGFVASGIDAIYAKSGTAVQYSTSGYTAGTGCTTNPTYQVTGALTRQW